MQGSIRMRPCRGDAPQALGPGGCRQGHGHRLSLPVPGGRHHRQGWQGLRLQSRLSRHTPWSARPPPFSPEARTHGRGEKAHFPLTGALRSAYRTPKAIRATICVSVRGVGELAVSRERPITMDPRLDGSLGYCNEADLNPRTNGGGDGKVHEGGQD